MWPQNHITSVQRLWGTYSTNLNRVVSPQPPWHFWTTVDQAVLHPTFTPTQSQIRNKGSTEERGKTWSRVSLNRLKRTSLKAGRMRKGPVKALIMKNPCNTGRHQALSPEERFPFIPSHYHQIGTAATINTLIGSVKQMESNERTIELNSMQCLKSMLKVSAIKQVSRENNVMHISIHAVGAVLQ